MKPPIFEPITPIKVSERWFPKGRNFGLYESGGRVAPNVTSVLGWKFPFDKSKWVKSETDIDHDAVTRESAKRGTAVHLAMEKWLQNQEHTPLRSICSGSTHFSVLFHERQKHWLLRSRCIIRSLVLAHMQVAVMDSCLLTAT